MRRTVGWQGRKSGAPVKTRRARRLEDPHPPTPAVLAARSCCRPPLSPSRSPRFLLRPPESLRKAGVPRPCPLSVRKGRAGRHRRSGERRRRRAAKRLRHRWLLRAVAAAQRRGRWRRRTSSSAARGCWRGCPWSSSPWSWPGPITPTWWSSVCVSKPTRFRCHSPAGEIPPFPEERRGGGGGRRSCPISGEGALSLRCFQRRDPREGKRRSPFSSQITLSAFRLLRLPPSCAKKSRGDSFSKAWVGVGGCNLLPAAASLFLSPRKEAMAKPLLGRGEEKHTLPKKTPPQTLFKQSPRFGYESKSPHLGRSGGIGKPRV